MFSLPSLSGRTAARQTTDAAPQAALPPTTHPAGTGLKADAPVFLVPYRGEAPAVLQTSRKREAMLLTTTATLEGYAIEEYLGPVSVHRVLGSGFYTEFFSGWADFFGSYSRTQRSKLDEIEAATLQAIREEARRFRANAVVGLRVDFDEITGAGKSMIMVTAMGTAIRCRRLGSGSHDDSTVQRVTAEQLHLERQKQHIIGTKPNTAAHPWSEDTWNFVLQHGVTELADRVIVQDATPEFGESAMYANPRRYFQRIPPDVAAEALYDEIERGKHWRFAVSMIVQLHLCSIPRVLRALEAAALEVRVAALSTLSAYAPSYERTDIALLRRLDEALDRAFPRAERLERAKRSMLGRGGTEEVWRCWGCETEETGNACGRCGRNDRGLGSNDPSFDRVREALRAQAGLLARMLGVTTTEQDR